jgi:ribosomal protein L16 Arg81 hydroxylase
MLTLNDLLSPIEPERFFADHHDRKPLHIPAGSDDRKREVLRWATFNGLLNQTSIWTAQSLKLVRDAEAVPAEHFCRVESTQSGPVMRPDPAKVAIHMAAGASAVAGDVQKLTPELAHLSDDLGRTFAASVGANVYCSFQGVRAFGTHYDLHHVFAVQTEGEKLWRLYSNRADRPVDFPPDTPETRRWLEQSRGPVSAEVLMRPGDVLYLPRGWYHDALAQDGASLHVTFSVTPLYGRIIFNLLEQAAMQDPAFREYLAPASSEGGRTLQSQLAGLGRKLAHLTTLPEFRDEVAMTQTRLNPSLPSFTLPVRTALTAWRRTGLAGPRETGPVAHAMAWAYAQPDFAIEELIAQFDFVPEADIRAAVDRAAAAGALQRL